MSSEILLVVKTHAFGDAMLATPAVRELMAKESDSQWQALSGPSTAPVWERFPGIEAVHIAPFPPPLGTAGRFRLMMWSVRTARVLRSVRRAYVFHTSPGVRRWVRFLTGAPLVSGGEKPLGTWENARGFDPVRFAGESYAEIAGVNPGSWQYEFASTPTELAMAGELLPGGRWVAIAPGGGRNPRDTVLRKRWGIEGYTEIADRLIGRGFGILLLGGPEDRPVSEALSAGLSYGADRIVDLTGRTNWGGTVALLRVGGLFVGNDSGTAHAAVAAGARAVVVFGPTDPSCLYATGSVNPVVSTSSCAPCYGNSVFAGCSRPEYDCMASVTIDRVWAMVERILDEDNNS
jgi:ADP-heptose:LPS heptosyltransferase